MFIHLQQIKAGQCQQQRFSFHESVSDSEALIYSRPLAVELQAYQVGDYVMVKGFAETWLELDCARCLISFEWHLYVNIEFAVDDNYDEADAPNLDLEHVPYGNGDVDVKPQIEAAMILALPLIPLCGENCKGLCIKCGVNKNETPCDCGAGDTDERWSKLKELLKDKEV